ncbi:unnamed protein product [Clonostachys chloroleuca]|uniref:C2H2-type domain-containing protein n=1 Tax=Clonostachys chloroleuca TaxID=1926264 RepID=A0AA35M5D9_9HYPO|nr:unnamed protein product [Clonostachys chloroleuca]
MASSNSQNPSGGNGLDSQFQNLGLGGNQPAVQDDIDYEPPPGPPPNWKPPATSKPAEPPRRTEQTSNPIHAEPKTSGSSRLHPSGVVPLTQCAKFAVGLDLDWFHYPSIPSFHICSYCYTQHIYNTQFQQLFKKTRLEAARDDQCQFGSARMKTIWATAASSGDLDPVFEFMKKRSAIPNCQLTKQLEGESWYVSQDLQGMTLCRACVEDTNIRPLFREKFTLQTTTAAYCDMSIRFIAGMFEKYKETGSWETFVSDVSARLSMGACPLREPAPAVGRLWMQTRQGHSRPSLKICAGCYMDFFVGNPDEAVFEKASESWDYVHCDIGKTFLQFTAVSTADKGDLSIFWKAVRGMRSQPQCNDQGIVGGNWYELSRKLPGFSVCGSCYASFVEPTGLGDHFISTGHSSQKTLCSFNRGHGRFTDYLVLFSRSIAIGNIKCLEEYVTKYGTVLVCPKYRPTSGKGGKFWGWDNLAICENCYIDFAKGTSLESRYLLKGSLDPVGKMCDLYSPRMRKLYSDACATGDLDGLLAKASQRRDVWSATVPVIHRMELNLQEAAFQADMHRQESTFYNNLGHYVHNIVGNTYTVGNSYAGYGHANEYLLTGHTHHKQAKEASRMAADESSWSTVSILKEQWAQVE